MAFWIKDAIPKQSYSSSFCRRSFWKEQRSATQCKCEKCHTWCIDLPVNQGPPNWCMAVIEGTDTPSHQTQRANYSKKFGSTIDARSLSMKLISRMMDKADSRMQDFQKARRGPTVPKKLMKHLSTKHTNLRFWGQDTFSDSPEAYFLPSKYYSNA